MSQAWSALASLGPVLTIVGGRLRSGGAWCNRGRASTAIVLNGRSILAQRASCMMEGHTGRAVARLVVRMQGRRMFMPPSARPCPTALHRLR